MVTITSAEFWIWPFVKIRVLEIFLYSKIALETERMVTADVPFLGALESSQAF